MSNLPSQTVTPSPAGAAAQPAAAHARPYQQCALGLLDTENDPDITFDEKGISNYYYEYRRQAEEKLLEGAAAEKRLNHWIENIKRSGKGKPYDCIIGLSGGVDSTYLAYVAKKHGLRPLAVHFDNGWNSELAVSNIENIVSRLDIDLYTYVINWEEFRDLQLAYLRASVVDIEAITDHAIFASLFRLARKHRVKYILSGFNVETEAILPAHWNYNKYDHINILDIHRKFGTTPLKTFPFMNLWVKKFYNTILGIQFVALLDMAPYNKAEVKKLIQEELGWRDYGGKHYESIFTRFYQGYILPRKFGIDKRKAHLSNLIYSGQMTKEAAIEELAQPIYPPELLKEDRIFVLKKLGLSEKEFDEIMNLPVRKHSEFDTERSTYTMYPWLRPFRPIVNLVKRFIRHN